MKLYQFLAENVFFTTRELAFKTGKTIDSASRQLMRMKREGTIVRVTQGVWANSMHPFYTPYGVVPKLLGNEQGYISFLNALHRNEIISLIPGTIQIATTGHSRTLRSPIGTFEFFKLRPEMFCSGLEESESRLLYFIASAEKALLDTLYISTRRGKRFSGLPELDLTEINEKEFLRLVGEQVKYALIKKNIIDKWYAIKRL